MTTTQPSWLDTTVYPFEPHFLQLKAGNMHYVDTGSGDPVLFVHGTPTWSFLYRNYIKEIGKTQRCIAPDHLGFGLSDKPVDFVGTPKAHSHNLEELVLALDLQNITLVVHDFGGPIGLSFALRHPDRIKRVVLMNTWLWETASNPEAQKVDKMINSWLGRFLYLRMNVSPTMLLKKAFHYKKNLTRKIHQQYKKPFPNKDSRVGLYEIAQSLVGASDWYQEQWEQFDRLAKKPFLIIWGMKDSFIKPDYLEKWKTRLPEAEVHTFKCGHFVQEEATESSIRILRTFLNTD